MRNSRYWDHHFFRQTWALMVWACGVKFDFKVADALETEYRAREMETF